MREYICRRCGWFIRHNGFEWQDSMGNEKCYDGGSHQSTGRGREVNEELRVHQES